MARTGAASISGLDDAIARARAYDATGVDALFFTGLKTGLKLEAVAAATKLPIVLGGFPEDMIDLDYLAANACGSRCRGTPRSPRRRKRSTRRSKRCAMASHRRI